MFSHLALRRPPSQQLQFLRNKPNNPPSPPTPPTKKKQPNKVLSREQHAAEVNNVAFNFLLIKYYFWLFGSSEETSFDFISIPQKRRIQSRRLLPAMTTAQRECFMFYVFVVFPCVSLLGDAVELRAAPSPRSKHGPFACREFTWFCKFLCQLLSRHSCVLPQPKDKNVFAHRHRHTVRVVRAWTAVGLFCVDSTGQLSGV